MENFAGLCTGSDMTRYVPIVVYVRQISVQSESTQQADTIALVIWRSNKGYLQLFLIVISHTVSTDAGTLVSTCV